MSTVTKWRRYVGDTDELNVQLSGLTEILGGAAVSCTLTRNGTATLLAATVDDAPNFIVKVPLTTFLTTAAPGTYEVRIILDDVTWPEKGAAELEVTATISP